MAEKKFLLRETIHPQTKQTVYLISEVGVQEKPVVLPNLLESLKQFVMQNAKTPQTMLYFYFQNKVCGIFNVLKSKQLLDKLVALKVDIKTTNIEFLLKNKLLEIQAGKTEEIKQVSTAAASQTLDDLALKVKIELLAKTKKAKDIQKSDVKGTLENFNGKIVIENTLENGNDVDVYYFLEQDKTKSQIFIKTISGIGTPTQYYSEAILASSKISEILKNTGFEATESIKISTVRYKMPKWVFAVIGVISGLFLINLIFLILSFAKIL
ncbi:hypothetical protein PR243_03285 [Metamycoplasma hyosynoviae]|uniref:hypothetical protein n=1 Tax=Metamycoplasma hyosynoviae TaxID=29559 RepID=UPI00235A21DE|nr:hypothetical protein [Metamycoplasma hyosynoviae]MDC8937591.1 hypothetical protein [Metamycoplasma hyosynoviae]